MHDVEKIKRTLYSMIRVKFDPLGLTFLKVFLVYKTALFYFVLLKLLFATQSKLVKNMHFSSFLFKCET